MGLGVLNDNKLQHVPGTATLDELSDPIAAAAAAETANYENLKRSKDGIILVPQPSNDPNDPLNWSLRRRDMITAILCLLSVIASTLSPLLAANTLTLTLYFRRPFTDIALLTGWHLFGVGLAGFIFVPSARVWGKRHLYLLGTVVIIISSAWGGGSGHNYKSLLAARVFQGVGLAPFEALVNTTIGDMYFVHERGKRMALSNLSLFGGAFFTPVIVGKLTSTLGWQWSFYLLAIFTAAMLPLVIFYVPETAYVREERFNTDTALTKNAAVVGQSNGANEEMTESISIEKPANNTAKASPSSEATPTPQLQKTLSPFNGRKTDDYFLQLLFRPLPLFLHPGIFWAMLIQGTLIGWTVLIGIVIGGLLLGPPLFFNEVQTGYMYTGAFIGALLGFLVAGVLADSSAKWMTRMNNGVYEPEFRIILVIPQLIFGCAGLYGFGIVSANTFKYGWFWMDFFFALEVMGMVIGAVASALYLVDAHRDIAVEAFTCLLIFKNIFSFGLTFSGYNWLAYTVGGVKPVFMAISSVQVVVCCLSIFMYVFGKKNRSFFARHDILELCHMKGEPPRWIRWVSETWVGLGNRLGGVFSKS